MNQSQNNNQKQKQNQKQISIVIVNYNAGPYLARCVRSLYQSQSKINFEIIVVDNASADDSIAQLIPLQVKYDNLIIKHSDTNQGFSRAVNQGVSMASGQYILILNPDCYVMSNTLERLLVAYQSQPNVGLVGAAVFNENGTEQRGARRREPTLWRSLVTFANLDKRLSGVNMTHLPFPKTAITLDAVSGAAMLIEKTRLQKLGGMDAGFFLHCEDLDICHRVRDAGYSVVFAPDAIVLHCQGVSSQHINWQVEQHKHNGMAYYYQKHYAKLPLQQHLMKALIAMRLRLIKWQKQPAERIKVSKKKHNPIAPRPISPINSEKPKILVTGGRSDVGESLLKLFSQVVDCPFEVIFLGQQLPHENALQSEAVHWLSLDFLAHLKSEMLGPVHAWVNLAPIWSNEALATQIMPLSPQKIIALSSSSILTKQNSDSPEDRRLVEKLKKGEATVAQFASTIPITILRPTMIYGGTRNKNVNLIKKIVKLTGMFPIVGAGEGLRQPVHCEDVAMACYQLIEQPTPVGRYTFNLPGKEVLTYRDMVERVFLSMGQSVRIIRLPLPLARLSIKLLRNLFRLRSLSADAANRMEQDMTFDYQLAQKTFSYQPRNFEPDR